MAGEVQCGGIRRSGTVRWCRKNSRISVCCVLVLRCGEVGVIGVVMVLHTAWQEDRKESGEVDGEDNG